METSPLKVAFCGFSANRTFFKKSENLLKTLPSHHGPAKKNPSDDSGGRVAKYEWEMGRIKLEQQEILSLPQLTWHERIDAPKNVIGLIGLAAIPSTGIFFLNKPTIMSTVFIFLVHSCKMKIAFTQLLYISL